MRVVHLFSNKGASSTIAKSWNPYQPATNLAATVGIITEGFFWLWKRLTEEKIIDEVLIVFESNSGPGTVKHTEKVSSLVIPHIDNLPPFLRGDDIFFVRGGFKAWIPLIKQVSLHNWILFYRANTGSGNWPFWDLIFNDLISKSFIDGQERFQLAFAKPIHPEIFYPQLLEKKYDLCLGSSHIHDEKGQWKGIEICKRFQKLFGTNLKCILPGQFIAGSKSSTIVSSVKEFNLDIEIPGMISRQEVGNILNKTKLFLHLGSKGQNDRGPLESLACGTPVILSFPKNHSPSLLKVLKNEVSIFKNVDDYSSCCQKIFEVLKHLPSKEEVLNFYKKTHDIDSVILPQMDKLFSFLKQFPNKDRKKLGSYLND